MLTKQVIVDNITVIENGCVHVRTRTSFMENGEEQSRTFHRHVITPGDDYAGEADMVRNICAAVHTPEVISAYKDTIANALRYVA